MEREEVREAVGAAVPTVEHVLEHHRRHGQPQPAPTTWAAVRYELPEALRALNSGRRAWDILRFIAHVDLVSASQVAELFFPEARNRNQANQLARRSLRWMAARHLVYGIPLVGVYKSKGEPAEAYALGRAGAQLLSNAESRSELAAYQWAASVEDFAAQKVPHDLAITATWLDLRRGPSSFRLGEHELVAELDPASLWSSSHLMLQVVVPSVYTRGLRHAELRSSKRSEERVRPQYTPSRPGKVEPDAFFTIAASFRGAPPAGAPQSFVLPTFLERDSGHRDNLDVAEQILSYCLLARSRAGFERLPQLDRPDGGWPVPEAGRDGKVQPGYSLPLVLVTQGYERGPGGWSRVRLLRRYARQMISERGLSERPPIFLTIADEIESNGLNAQTVDLWADRPEELPEFRPLLNCLLEANRPLISIEMIDTESPIVPDPAGARWAGGSRYGPSGAASPRREAEAERERRFAELEDFKRHAELSEAALQQHGRQPLAGLEEGSP